MLISKEQYDGLYRTGHDRLRTNWRRGFIRNPLQRDWLVKSVCDAIRDEFKEGFAEYNGDVTAIRSTLEANVYQRVVNKNQISMGDGTYGFAIMSIILAAVLTWLIKELLDWLVHG